MLWASGNPVSSVRERLPQPLDSWKPEVGKGHGLSEEWAKRKCPQHCSLGMRWATWRYHPLAGPTPPQSRAGENVRTQQQSYRTFFSGGAGCATQGALCKRTDKHRCQEGAPGEHAHAAIAYARAPACCPMNSNAATAGKL